MKRIALMAVAACGHPAPARVVPAAAALELVGAGTLSSPYNEIRLATSPDGNTRLWGSTDRPGGPGGWNVWMSHRDNDVWSAPVPASFDSEANDFDPAYSPDGRFVYFFSNRPGGAGGDDIYRVPVRSDGFGEVEHLGAEVNTDGDEWAPSPSPDGTLLMFASNRPHAKHDLYLARIAGPGFAKAELLPGAINTPDNDEFDGTFLPDGSIVFTRSPDVENAELTLYVSHRGPNGYDAGTALPAPFNAAGSSALGPSVSAKEPGMLYLSTKRPGGPGKLDIYRARMP